MTVQNVHAFVLQFHLEDSAQDLIEYALIGTIISLSALAGMSTLASSINAGFSRISEHLS